MQGSAKLMRSPLDPRVCTVACDANALDGAGVSGELADRFRDLSSQGALTIVVGKGVGDEVQHPRTPAGVRQAISPHTQNVRSRPTHTQQIARFCVQSILQGDAQSGKHSADATHLSEAAEAGCAYFITHDKRILKKRQELSEVLPPSLRIVTLAEFMRIFDDYARDGLA
jgi:hypothetical protein